MWGNPRRELPGHRKAEDCAELRANGDLRQVRKDKTGTYYALTPAGLKRRAEIGKKSEGKKAATPAKKSGPPPAVLTSAPARLDVLQRLASDTRTALDALLAVSGVVEKFAGLPVMSPHPWAWTPLAPAEQQLVGAARKALDAWLEQAVAAIRACAPERLEDFTDEQDHLLRVVDRSSKSDGPTAPDVAGTQRYAHEALDHQLEVVQNLPSANAVPETVLVPDTNALILNPAIETWNLSTGRVVVTVLPQVIAELDAKKMDRTIGDKAKSLIRRFKEFDRRGDTLVGVPVVGKIMFREVAVDASFDDAPSWLRQSNVDDRILVGALDLSQQELASRIVLATHDRNMQNKARRLGLPYVDSDEL
jgi:rRNA maturation endonuclease Nob1